MRAAASELPDRPIECTWCSPWQCVAASERLQPITASLCAKPHFGSFFGMFGEIASSRTWPTEVSIAPPARHAHGLRGWSASEPHTQPQSSARTLTLVFHWI
mgnify:CR=1 FL=1